MKNRISIVQGDITKLKVDAIVNAANTTLLGGGGVDGAVHKAGGPELLAECKMLGGCPTGEARLTKGYNLSAKFVIHTVGPVWYDGKKDEEKLLKQCYQNSLILSNQNDLKTIAFPNISTGVYHFPKELAAEIAVTTIQNYLENNEIIKQVIFCCFDEENYSIYQSLLIC
ncbi:MAG: O-acetyl-ADP-ribose deacetylase [Fidelibacterota bacterium]